MQVRPLPDDMDDITTKRSQLADAMAVAGLPTIAHVIVHTPEQMWRLVGEEKHARSKRK